MTTYLITFYSQFDAILANRILRSAGLAVQLMPVPRAVSSSCGTCVKFQLEGGLPETRALLPGVELENVYGQIGEHWERLQ